MAYVILGLKDRIIFPLEDGVVLLYPDEYLHLTGDKVESNQILLVNPTRRWGKRCIQDFVDSGLVKELDFTQVDVNKVLELF